MYCYNYLTEHHCVYIVVSSSQMPSDAVQPMSGTAGSAIIGELLKQQSYKDLLTQWLNTLVCVIIIRVCISLSHYSDYSICGSC